MRRWLRVPFCMRSITAPEIIADTANTVCNHPMVFTQALLPLNADSFGARRESSTRRRFFWHWLVTRDPELFQIQREQPEIDLQHVHPWLATLLECLTPFDECQPPPCKRIEVDESPRPLQRIQFSGKQSAKGLELSARLLEPFLSLAKRERRSEISKHLIRPIVQSSCHGHLATVPRAQHDPGGCTRELGSARNAVSLTLFHDYASTRRQAIIIERGTERDTADEGDRAFSARRRPVDPKMTIVRRTERPDRLNRLLRSLRWSILRRWLNSAECHEHAQAGEGERASHSPGERRLRDAADHP